MVCGSPHLCGLWCKVQWLRCACVVCRPTYRQGVLYCVDCIRCFWPCVWLCMQDVAELDARGSHMRCCLRRKALGFRTSAATFNDLKEGKTVRAPFHWFIYERFLEKFKWYDQPTLPTSAGRTPSSSTAARRLFDHISRQQKSSGMSCKEGLGMRIAQRLSTAIQVANARAVFKRLGPMTTGASLVADLEAADFDMLAGDAEVA